MLAFVINGGHPDRKVALLEQLVERLGYTISRKDTFSALITDPELKAKGDSLVLIPATEAFYVNAEDVVGLANKLKGRAFVIYVADAISQAH